MSVNTLRLQQNGHHFADNISILISVYWNCYIFIQILPKSVIDGLIDNEASLVSVKVLCQTGDKPLREPMVMESYFAW